MHVALTECHVLSRQIPRSMHKMMNMPPSCTDNTDVTDDVKDIVYHNETHAVAFPSVRTLLPHQQFDLFRSNTICQGS
jgi:hypothetical protein